MVWANAIYAFSYTGTSQELVTGNPTNIGISGLTPGNWYTFTVTGFNSAGWSTWANWSPWLFIPATPTPTPSPTSAPVTHSVAVIIDPTAQVGFGFTTPDGGPVHVGDRIVWVNQTSAPHGVTWDTTGSPANGPIFGAGTTTAPIVMTSAGTFHYHCTVHGPSMAGTITVLS
jgi:plastocyanin